MSHIFSHSDMDSEAPPSRVTQPSFDMQVDFFDALSAGDIEKAANSFSLDGKLLFPGLRPVIGRSLVKRMLAIIRRRYETIAWCRTSPFISSDGWLVASWSVSGTFKGSAQLYENEVLSLVRLDCEGRIAMLSDYFKDTLAFNPSRSHIPTNNIMAGSATGPVFVSGS